MLDSKDSLIFPLAITHNYTVGGTTQCYNWQYATIIQQAVQLNVTFGNMAQLYIQ